MGTILVCEYPPGEWLPPWQRQKRVLLDAEARSVVFQHCHYRRSFWTIRPEAERKCSLDDVLAVHGWRRPFSLNSAYSVTVVTPFGRPCWGARIPGTRSCLGG